MPLKHIQSEKHVHGLLFEDGERARQEIPFDLNLSWNTREKSYHLASYSATHYVLLFNPLGKACTITLGRADIRTLIYSLGQKPSCEQTQGRSGLHWSWVVNNHQSCSGLRALSTAHLSFQARARGATYSSLEHKPKKQEQQKEWPFSYNRDNLLSSRKPAHTCRFLLLEEDQMLHQFRTLPVQLTLPNSHTPAGNSLLGMNPINPTSAVGVNSFSTAGAAGSLI